MSELAGRYRLGEVLGTGGTSTVYRATDATLGVERAVKVLRGEGAGIDAQRARLRSEARAMARVTHPNILRVYDVGTDEGQDFFVMELAIGGTLQERVDTEGPLSPVLACRYALQVLGALAAAHDAGVIHRDVKPQNVLLDRDGVALLADFGIALLADGHESRHTRVGVAMGSLTYMPPEQRLDARGVGVGADLYATGATLYAVLTGATPVDLFLASPGSARWDDVPTALRPILQRATRLVSDERYPSARDMAAALVAAMARLPPDPLPHPRDEAAWAGIRDRVLASLAGPLGPPGPPEEAAKPAPRRRRGDAAVAPTMHADAAPPKVASARRRTVALAALGVAVVGLAFAVSSREEAPDRNGVFGRMQPPAEVASTAPTGAEGTAGADGVTTSPSGPSAAGGATTGAASSIPVPEGAEGGLAIEPKEATRPSTKPRRAVSASSSGRGGVAVVESPVGAWTGSFNGKGVRFELDGRDTALYGTVTVRFQGNAIVNRVRGTFDSDTRQLELADVSETPDSGRYTATLTDEPALEGRFEAAETGRVVAFRVVPAP